MRDTSIINAAIAPTGALSAVPGLPELCAETLGDARICIAVLDGPVDRSHPCFAEARLTALPTLVSESPGDGRMAAHGTHIASVLFGRPGSVVRGIAPGCRGVIAQIYSDARGGPASQLDLARAIKLAVEAGAHVINISGGELSNDGDADPMLVRAVHFCRDEGVLVVAAAGNDSCRCLHIPAALPSVLAVGAMDASGVPLDSSNWGDAYKTQGVLAPGQNVLGAIPGGAVAAKSGTSFATPVVSGAIALLLSLQVVRGEKPDPYAVRDAILASALRCDPERLADCQRFLVGRLNIAGAYPLLISRKRRNPMADDRSTEDGLRVGESSEFAQTEAPGISGSESLAAVIDSAVNPCEISAPSDAPSAAKSSAGMITGRPAASAPRTSGVDPSCDCRSKSKRLVFAIGTIGYDFGTEAVRDSFKALMPNVAPDGTPYSFEAFPHAVPLPANPYDPRQIVNYLGGYPPPGAPDPRNGGFPTIGGFPAYNPAIPSPVPSPPPEYRPVLEASLPAARDLIWTLNIELTPIYAIRPSGSFSTEVYQRLVEFLAGQIRNPQKTPPCAEHPEGEDDPDFVSRVSIPGVLKDETVQLYSGQVVPIVVPNWRAMYAWNENLLVDAVMAQVRETAALQQLDPDELTAIINSVKKSLRNLLDRIYYDLRNLGQNSSERALNFVATNAFQAASVLAQTLIPSVAPLTPRGAQAVLTGTLQLDTITTERSAFCRKDSDCWDVKLRFFDPENDRRARPVHRFTVDVSGAIPVQIGPVRTWAEAG
ncbi:MAG TPA: S8 family serine peptidase [Pirellulales bacterium]|jgi:hypothetical protein|nr:S8 family serine peptidase [Pirellulales bacterium]